MAHSALRLRAGALVAAGALTLGGLVAASPAAAEPIEQDQPTIELSQTTFPAGDWLGGFTVTGYGFDPEFPTASLSIGASGENGGGGIFFDDVDITSEGTFEAVIDPRVPTQAPDANGYPIYTVSVAQNVGTPQWLVSNPVTLTITEGASVTAPGELTAAEIAAGITATYAGFASDEPIGYEFLLWRWTEAEGEQLIDEDWGNTQADSNGAGTVTAALEGAQPGDTVEVNIYGEGGRIAAAWIQVVEVPAPAPTPVDPAPAPAAPAGDVNRLPDTGVDLGIGITALALLAFGAGALLVTRRTRASLQR
ncbi:hypothetical protein [Agromyces silvae]|uniref:hypothetical protein n=1 Tax=Agromyces silvae TaxID=3388266 RepID=UPI00280B499B|nr:hypothetical protein [Agromyces protaetiae]